MAIDVLSDLHVCFEKSKLKKKTKRKSVSASGDEEPEWIEVVVDLLLSLLSQNKHVLRQVVSSVMTILSPHINDNALQVRGCFHFIILLHDTYVCLCISQQSEVVQVSAVKYL